MRLLFNWALALAAAAWIGAPAALADEKSPVAIKPAEDAAAEMIAAVSSLPEPYRPDVVKALGAAEKNQGELFKAIGATPADHREALAFLLVHMPADDLTSLKAEFLVENIDYAYRARQAAPWGKDLRDELFFNYVLPYANLNERRDNWRKDFYDKFLGVVKDCKTPGEAAMVLNKEVFPKLNVKYHPTKRPKPDQSPYESTAAGYASCTGLSILLSDACRALCIPARAVGTQQWTNTAGNHTWLEVWDRQWNYVGACEPGPLNKTWFAGNAAQADPAQLEHRIFAASYARTGKYFPLVWAPDDKNVPGVDVTVFYTHRAPLKLNILDMPDGKPQTARLIIRHDGEVVAAGGDGSTFEFELARGEKYKAELVFAGGKAIVREFMFKDGDSEVFLYTVNSHR